MQTLSEVYDHALAVRVKVTLSFIIAALLGCGAFTFSYLLTGQYLLILAILVPFLLPISIFGALIWRSNSYRYVRLYWYYFYSVMGGLNLFSSPDYLADFFISIPLSGAAFLALRAKDALFGLAYLWFLYIGSALVVYYFEPFPIVYTNDSTGSLAVAFFIALIGGCITYYTFARFYQNASDELGRSLIALQKANDDNSLLFNVLFHDFRNYLNLVSLNIEKMSVEDSEDEKERAYSNITDQISELSNLLNHVQLIQTQFENKSDFPLQDIELNTILEKLELLFRHQILKKELMMDYAVEESVCVHVNPDVFVHLILGNILGNAVKFTPAGETIRVSAEKQSKAILVKVQNPAFSENLSNLKKITDNQKVENSNPGSDNEQGQGMGISIVRQFCRANGITFNSSLDSLPDQERLTFTVELEIPNRA